MATLILLNNFMHDFSAAGWLFGSVLLWAILKRKPSHPDAAGAVRDILNTVLGLMRLSLAGIVVFGVVRALAYKDFEWNPAAGDSQLTLLIVKHIILTGIFALGVWVYVQARRYIGKRTHEDKK